VSAEVIQFRAPTTPERLAAAATAHRKQLTQGRDHLLADLRPHITRDYLSLNEGAAYFRVGLPAMLALAHANRAELSEVGYRPDTGLTRRAVLHLALLFPLKESERADVLKRALGDLSARQPAAVAPVVIPNHEVFCRRLLNAASELAEDTQDGDPAALWAKVSCMDRHELQGVTVALAAMLPLDQSGLRGYLRQLGQAVLCEREESAHPSRLAAAGLATLVPEPAV
jgi:hypothetical protein